MEKLDKIKKWAKDNGYETNTNELEQSTQLSKLHITTSGVNIQQFIHVCLEPNLNIDSEIDTFLVFFVNKKEQLDELFIPLNNVKRDEKLLRQYLEQDEPHEPTLDEKKDLFREGE